MILMAFPMENQIRYDYPDAVFAVLTSDHLIEPRDEFQRKMDTGFRLVEQNPRRLVTFAITATYPATGPGLSSRPASSKIIKISSRGT